MKRIRMQVVVEEVEESGADAQELGQIRKVADGSYEQLMTDEASESIDEMEAAVIRMQYEVGRGALADHLSEVAKKKPARRPKKVSGSTSTRPPIE
jgi:hypothetical protein